MLGSSFIPYETIKATYTCVRNGKWSSVFAHLSRYPNLVYVTDPFVGAKGWTLMDHAVFQMNLDVIKTLREQHNYFMHPNGAVVLHHVQQKNWQWIMLLLKESILSANVEYVLPEGINMTLLDLAINDGQTYLARVLQNEYQGRTAEEILEYSLRAKMFNAVQKKDWQAVYAILDQDQVSVDSIDVWINKGWVLLQYAYAQQNQYAILKLLDHYGASLDEIRNMDLELYNMILSFYDAAKYASFVREMADLTMAFEQHTLVSEKSDFGPIARPILTGFSSIMDCTSDSLSAERGIHLLEKDFPSKKANRSVYFNQA